jgi:REP element-mobilizing transposase RayT
MPYEALLAGRCSRVGVTYLVTTATAGRRRVFDSFSLAAIVARELIQCEHARCWHLHAWVVMPDHLHLLLELRSGTLESTMRTFKGRCAHRINAARACDGSLWQAGYHDRAVRRDEDLVAIARYVIANPVRAGLVTRIGAYPFWNAAWL